MINKELNSINLMQDKLKKISNLIASLDNKGKGYSGEWLKQEIESILKEK